MPCHRYDKWSYAYRDTSGSRVHQSERYDDYGESFAPGDIIGCAIYLKPPIIPHATGNLVGSSYSLAPAVAGASLIGGGGGVARWINIGGFTFQPSEPTKIAVMLALARYFDSQPLDKMRSILTYLPPLVMIIVPFILVVEQPDLGTALALALLLDRLPDGGQQSTSANGWPCAG